MVRIRRWAGLALIASSGLLPSSPARAEAKPPSKAAYDKAAFQAAHRKALDFIAGQQKADGGDAGGWAVEFPGRGAAVDLGVSGICACALAQAPEREKYKVQIDRAVGYILRQSQPDGSFCDPSGILKNYKTSVAVLALTAVDAEKHKDRVIKARDYLLSIQARDGIEKGGFDYGNPPRAGGPAGEEKKVKADLSNTAYALMALKAAGLPPDHPAYKDAVAFVEACQNRSENASVVGALAALNVVPLEDSENRGGMKYTPVGSGRDAMVEMPDGKKGAPSYGSMTYGGLLSFIYAGVQKDDPRVQAAYDWIRGHYTLEENPGLRREKPGTGKQGLYYYFHSFAKALDAYGDETIKTKDGAARKWAEDLAAELVRLQKPDGSWTNENDRWMEGDTRLVTAMAAMSMNILAKRLKP